MTIYELTTSKMARLVSLFSLTSSLAVASVLLSGLSDIDLIAIGGNVIAIGTGLIAVYASWRKLRREQILEDIKAGIASKPNVSAEIDRLDRLKSKIIALKERNIELEAINDDLERSAAAWRELYMTLMKDRFPAPHPSKPDVPLPSSAGEVQA